MIRVTDTELLNAGFRFAMSLSGNRADAEDLVHDAWLNLMRRYGESPNKQLLFRTIRNRHIDCIRKAKLVENHRMAEIRDSSEEIPLQTYHLAVESYDPADIDLYLARLRDSEREMLFLSVVEGYTADEIAFMTKTVRGTVLSSLHRTRKKLRKWLLEDEEPANNVVHFKPRDRKS